MDKVNEDYNLPQIYLANNIRNLRKRNSWSQEELAGKVGLNRGNIASYEKGTAEPKICNLVKLARCFGVSILELTGFDMAQHVSNGVSQNTSQLTISEEEKQQFEMLLTQFKELETVVESIYNCHCFTLKNLPQSSPELQTISTHFQQMHEVTNALLKNHRSVLRFIRNQIMEE